MLKERLLQDQSEASLRFDKKSQQIAWLKALHWLSDRGYGGDVLLLKLLSFVSQPRLISQAQQTWTVQ
jgi:hypothetical protein